MTVTVAIHGAAGRMGKRLVALGAVDPRLKLAAAIDHPKHADLGKDAGTLAGISPLGIPLSSELPAGIGAVIDFSVPKACEQILARCLERKTPLVVATTGLEPPVHEAIRKASAQIPIVWSPNMSMAVNLAMKLAEMAGRALKDHPSGADVEILERHHRFKEDSPSGTALQFGKIIAAAMGQTEHIHGRQGQVGKRPLAEIGYHAIRTGDNPGEHTIIFGLLGETIEVTVRASNRDCYAQGALAAAHFVAGKPAGLYSMYDVLGLG